MGSLSVWSEEEGLLGVEVKFHASRGRGWKNSVPKTVGIPHRFSPLHSAPLLPCGLSPASPLPHFISQSINE